MKKNKRKRKKRIKKSILLFLLIIIIICIYIFIRHNITFELNGPKDITLNYGDKYVEKGTKVKIFNRNYDKEVNEKSNLNLNKLGNYEIKYTVKLWGLNLSKKRYIEIIDKEKPKITLNGNDVIRLYLGEKYQEQGVKAIDNYDGDITSKVSTTGKVNYNKEGIYKVTYKVTDSSLNTSVTTRKIYVIYKDVNPNNRLKLSDVNNVVPDKDGKFISDYIVKNNLRVSIGYYNLNTHNTYYYNEDKLYYGASLIKILDALYLYEHSELLNNDIEKKIAQVIINSDNLKHKELVEYIGKDKLKEYGYSLGAKYTLHGHDNFGNTNVLDQIEYYKKVYEVIKKDNNLEEYLLDSISNYIKVDDIKTLCKFGYYKYVFHNSGIVLDEEPYIIIVLTEHGLDNYDEIIANISTLVYKYHKLQ